MKNFKQFLESRHYYGWTPRKDREVAVPEDKHGKEFSHDDEAPELTNALKFFGFNSEEEAKKEMTAIHSKAYNMKQRAVTPEEKALIDQYFKIITQSMSR